MLTQDQKNLLFYALEATQKTLFFNRSWQEIASDPECFQLQTDEYNKITKDLDKLNDLIDKTLDDLCK